MPVLTIVFCDLLLNAFANIDDTLLLIFKLVLLLLLFALLLLLWLLLLLLLGVVEVAGCVLLILLAVIAAAADNNERAPAAPLTPDDAVAFPLLGPIGDIGGVLLLGIAVVFVWAGSFYLGGQTYATYDKSPTKVVFYKSGGGGGIGGAKTEKFSKETRWQQQRFGATAATTHTFNESIMYSEHQGRTMIKVNKNKTNF